MEGWGLPHPPRSSRAGCGECLPARTSRRDRRSASRSSAFSAWLFASGIAGAAASPPGLHPGTRWTWQPGSRGGANLTYLTGLFILAFGIALIRGVLVNALAYLSAAVSARFRHATSPRRLPPHVPARATRDADGRSRGSHDLFSRQAELVGAAENASLRSDLSLPHPRARPLGPDTASEFLAGGEFSPPGRPRLVDRAAKWRRTSAARLDSDPDPRKVRWHSWWKASASCTWSSASRWSDSTRTASNDSLASRAARAGGSCAARPWPRHCSARWRSSPALPCSISPRGRCWPASSRSRDWP